MITWDDERGGQDGQRERGYVLPGQTPVVRKPVKKCRLKLISSIMNQGLMRFMIYEQTLTAKVLIGFMSRLIQDPPKKIFLILDNLKVHRSQAVRTGLKARRDRVEVFYLPPIRPS